MANKEKRKKEVKKAPKLTAKEKKAKKAAAKKAKKNAKGKWCECNSYQDGIRRGNKRKGGEGLAR